MGEVFSCYQWRGQALQRVNKDGMRQGQQAGLHLTLYAGVPSAGNARIQRGIGCKDGSFLGA